MTLLNITDVQDDTAADANDLNSRFTQVSQVVNGNIDAQNISDSAVTQSKLASGAVTVSKLGLTKTQDANGWTVYDFGAWKEYRKKVTYVSPGAIPAAQRTPIANAVTLPVGKTFNDVSFSLTGVPINNYASHAVFGAQGAATATAFDVYLGNSFNSTLTFDAGFISLFCTDF